MAFDFLSRREPRRILAENPIRLIVLFLSLFLIPLGINCAKYNIFTTIFKSSPTHYIRGWVLFRGASLVADQSC
jgi:hypothetical protein